MLGMYEFLKIHALNVSINQYFVKLIIFLL